LTHEEPQPSKRSKRLYILWATVLALLITAALFSWLVVVPVLRARSAAKLPEGGARPVIGECERRLRRVALICLEHARRHDGRMPADMGEVKALWEQDGGTYPLCCPKSGKEYVLEGQWCDPERVSGGWILVWCQHQLTPTHRAVGFVDGRARMHGERDFHKTLAKQRRLMKEWREAGARKADIPKFFGKLPEDTPE